MKRYIVALVTVVFIGCGSSNTALSVAIDTDKSELVEGQSVTLKAEVIGNKEGLSYVWSENSNILGSDTTLTKKNFSLGKHEIDVKVSNGTQTVTDKKTITVSEFLLTLRDSKINHSIEHGKTNYDLDENVVLEATIKGSAKADTYTWKENSKTIATTSKLDKKFSIGSHKVTVEARVNNLVKSVSFDFNVSNWSNFETKTLSSRKDKVLVDRDKNLMWVNDTDENKKACLAVHEARLDVAQKVSQEFCQNIEFGGFDKGSWRAPTADELVNFIKQTVEANILPVYYQPCSLLFVDEDGVSHVVATRYAIENEIEILPIPSRNANLGEVLEFRTNYGIRCVKSLN